MFTLPEDATLDEVRAFFKNDRFPTTTCKPTIMEASHGHSLVTMEIEDHHLNGFDSLMGGVSFTIADYAFGIASNIGQEPTVSVGCTIDFMGPARGKTLIVACDLEKDGRTMCFATACITDELGTKVARMNITGYRKR